jgi:signal transduction histidine kinase
MRNFSSQSLPPLRLLLYLEWILLAVAILSSIALPPIYATRAPLWTNSLYMLAFGLMGLRLPSQSLGAKLLYTAAEFGFMLLPMVTEYRIRFIPVLGLVIALRSCQMFGLSGRLWTAGLVFMTYLSTLFLRVQAPIPRRFPGPHRLPHRPPFNPLGFALNNIVLLGLALTFILLLVNALLAERKNRQDLAIAHERLRRYALQIENQATLQERNRIAREIHDSLGHSLTAQSIQLENALMYLPTQPDKTRTFLTEARSLGAQALHEVRRSVAALRSNPLQRQSLSEGLLTLFDDFQRRSGINLEHEIEMEPALTGDIGATIYRIVQEALMNISKHSQASQVWVQLHVQPTALILTIQDNGRGFNPTQNTTGFGLQGMRERAATLGGTCQINSEPGQGCQIKVTIPHMALTAI